MNKFMVTIINESGKIRREVITTDKKAINMHTAKKVLKSGEKISKIECINPTDDLDIILGKKHMLTFVGAVIFASESILIGSKDIIGQITHVDINRLQKRSKGLYFDTEHNITIKIGA